MTQKDRILFFFSSNPSMEYTPTDISKQFPKFAKSSVRRVLQELLADNKLIRETRGHYNINDEELINGEFKTDFRSGERCEIDFSLHEEFKGAMEIYLVKQEEANVE